MIPAVRPSLLSASPLLAVLSPFSVLLGGCATADAAPPPTGASLNDCPAGKGTTYDVGPSQKLQNLSDVPWESLDEGDRVRIAWRPTSYREKILVSGRGTPAQPIRICGVRGPKGQLPVIDGEGATTRTSMRMKFPNEARGVLTFAMRAGQHWGAKPAHVLVEGLELRGAHPGPDDKPREFTNALGKRERFSRNGASIFIERGEHITVRGCTLTDSAYGFFVASAGDEATLSRSIVLERSHVHGNGLEGHEGRHNAYTEASGIVFQFNHFGPLRPGAPGNNIKDRSAGTVVRYNWIEGGAHMIDLVEPEESAPVMLKEPNFLRTYVYGNVLVNRPSDGSRILHYGGDHGNPAKYREGILYFVNNTVVIHEGRRDTTLFRLETPKEIVEAQNNVIFRAGTSSLFLGRELGTLRFRGNAISGGFEKFRHPGQAGGVIEVLEDLTVLDASPFVDLAQEDLRPRATKPPGNPSLPAGYPSEHRPDQAYVKHQGATARRGRPPVTGALDP